VRLEPTTAWTSDELNKIGKAEELKIASLRRDGTLRNSVIIWVVRVGYVAPMLTPEVRAATIKLVPRSTGS
jgi:hypothetical protein